jgi:hypothetical protein
MSESSGLRQSLIAGVLALLISGGCAAHTKPLGDQDKPMSGMLTDPRGDVTPSTQLPTPPDLVAATIEVSHGVFTLTISFARGTLSPQTSVTVYLDTDENPSTGEKTFKTDSAPIGADYVIRGLQPHDPAKASLTHQTGSNQQDFNGIVDVTTPAPDTRRIELPLSRLGNDDGRLRFKVMCAQVVSFTPTNQGSTQTIVYADTMPDVGGKAGVVK